MDQEFTTSDIESLVDRVLREHGATRDAIVPILSEINRVLGYIPAAALPEIRRRIQDPDEGLFLADSHLYSAASFYQMFALRPHRQARDTDLRKRALPRGGCAPGLRGPPGAVGLAARRNQRG